MNRNDISVIYRTTLSGKKIKIYTGKIQPDEDREYDNGLRDIVRIKVGAQLSRGVPIAAYDAKSKYVFLEYPDGRIEKRYET